MRPRRTRKLLSGALGLIVVGVLWFYFAPTPLGGSTTYVVTRGISMEPRFHTGDLAVVRSQSSYHVGEIVAYHNNMLHTIVLHRIVGLEGDRYVFKGDNNNFIDPERPLASQLIGSLWLHVPGAGVSLQMIRSPLVVGLLLFCGVLLLTGGVFARRRRRRGRRRREEIIARPARISPGSPEWPGLAVVSIALVALLPFLLLAVLAFTRAPSAPRAYSVPYKQSGALSYTASAAPGPVYQGDQAVTGEPLFTRVLSAVDFRFSYSFESPVAHSLTGKAWLAATLTASAGWHKTLELGAPSYFRGDHATVAGTLNVSSLVALVRSFENATDVRSSYALTIVPHVSSVGSAGSAPLHTTFSPEVNFSLNEYEAEPTATEHGLLGSAKSTTNQFAPSRSGSVQVSRNEARSLSLGFARLTVPAARTVALAGIGAIVGAVLAILALMRTSGAFAPPRRPGESAAILARYGGLIIPVARVWPLPGVPVIDVADMDALARIAEHYDRSILHEVTDQAESFWVSDESGQFRYAPEPSTRGPGEGAPIGDARATVTASAGPCDEQLRPRGTAPAFQPEPVTMELAVDAVTEELRLAVDPLHSAQ